MITSDFVYQRLSLSAVLAGVPGVGSLLGELSTQLSLSAASYISGFIDSPVLCLVHKMRNWMETDKTLFVRLNASSSFIRARFYCL